MRSTAALLFTHELSADQRWKLVQSLYGQERSLLEGSVALGVVLVVAWARTGARAFALLLLLNAAVLAGRLLVRRAFFRRAVISGTGTDAGSGRGGDGGASSQEWARRFVYGAVATGLVWGGTTFLVLFRLVDPMTQMAVVAVQAGWLGGAGVRNAASPAAVTGQTCACSLPAIAGSLFSLDPFHEAFAVLFCVQISSTLSIARYLGEQTLSLLGSESRLAEMNGRLQQACADFGQANVTLQRLSATDGLTGIGNRRAFDAALQTEWARAAREETELSLLMVDVDHFKAFNDEYGHPAGDLCLQMLAGVIDGALRRPPDFAARFGGEEFVALLPGTGEAGARDVGERLQRDLAVVAMAHRGSRCDRVTVSIGIATARPGHEPGTVGLAQSLIDEADRALYCAKQAGRNRIWPLGDVTGGRSTTEPDADLAPLLPAWLAPAGANEALLGAPNAG